MKVLNIAVDMKNSTADYLCSSGESLSMDESLNTSPRFGIEIVSKSDKGS
jgi:hypothetical protein